MLLYVHVPFCRSKCDYCAFYSTPLKDITDVQLYGDALIAEITHWGKRLNNPPVSSIFFGGGTPSLLPTWLMERIIAALRDNFTWEQGYEFTMEGNPDSLDLGTLGDMFRLGVNRLSIGVQSLENEELRAIGRAHSAEQAYAVVDGARRAGFRNIGLDFIWGLPGSRLGSWQKQLRTVVKELSPEHLSCYNLTIEPDTPLEKRVDNGELVLSPDDEQTRMFMNGSDFLEASGYIHYEISNFAKMGFFCRHNIGYWEGEPYLGFGPSAVSTIGNRRRENASDVRGWAEDLARGNWDGKTENLSEEDRINELIMLSLRMSRGLSLKDYKARTGKAFTVEHGPLLQVLRQHELVRITKEYVRLSKNGMLVSNSIIEKFLQNSSAANEAVNEAIDEAVAAAKAPEKSEKEE